MPGGDHQLAFTGCGALDEQVDPRVGRGAARLIQRHLLADDGSEVAVESEQESLHVAGQGLALGTEREALGGRDLREAHHLQEAEDGVGAAVVKVAEAADLIPLMGVVER